jgi:hypothetical protein
MEGKKNRGRETRRGRQRNQKRDDKRKGGREKLHVVKGKRSEGYKKGREIGWEEKEWRKRMGGGGRELEFVDEFISEIH